ncbi:hypothetical protein WJX72_000523 [[Myrmecia] bisecta]|uniref:Uncharacterized protein n=1 Tax=[Myrmecia] bisecta TaxID=41462 RepID=A0AAW1PRJ5_9CHLO
MEQQDLYGPMPPLNGVQSNAAIMLGMLGAIGAGVPLLGAHFFFLLQMFHQQSGRGDKYTPAYFRARIYFYAFLLVLRGVAESALGALIRDDIGSGMLAAPVVTLPFVVVYPEISIADGLLVLCFGLLGIIIAVAGLRGMAVPYFGLGAFVIVFQLATYILTQIGLSPAPKVVAAILTGNTVIGVLMPVYLVANMQQRPDYCHLPAPSEVLL